MTGGNYFQTPPTNKVPGLMEGFVSWLSSDSAHELYLVILSGISLVTTRSLAISD